MVFKRNQHKTEANFGPPPPRRKKGGFPFGVPSVPPPYSETWGVFFFRGPRNGAQIVFYFLLFKGRSLWLEPLSLSNCLDASVKF